MSKIQKLEEDLYKCLKILMIDRSALKIEEEEFLSVAKEYGSELAGNSDTTLHLKANIAKFEEQRNIFLLELLNEINTI